MGALVRAGGGIVRGIAVTRHMGSARSIQDDAAAVVGIAAAQISGICKVIIPLENEKRLEEVPKNILKGIEVVAVEKMDEVMAEALVWDDHVEAEMFTDNKTGDAL